MSSKRQPIKVSGLIKSGALKPAPESVVDRMPSFDADPAAVKIVSPEMDSPVESSPQLSVVESDRGIESSHSSDIRKAPAPETDDIRSAISADSSGEITNVELIPIAKIRRGRYQNRIKLDEAYIADLADNIRTDELNSPIVVRKIGEWYELVAGENRYEAVKLNGDSNIPALVKSLDEKQAARATVFDNIFHKITNDYELYLGFTMLLEMEAVPSQRQLAKDSGMSKTQVDRIMSFRKLPEEAHAILKEQPTLIGANVAHDLGGLVDDGHSDLVVEAVKKVQSGELTQGRACSWVIAKSSPKEKKSSRAVTHLKGKTFCTLERDGSHIKIKIASGIDSESLENEIFQLLTEKAKQSAEE